ncbi:MAG: ECF transporter S component [Chloroflexi bacterium]|nr:ECF transporter S component [Chloroflexota bacterium]
MRTLRAVNNAAMALASLIGLVAFLYPFFNLNLDQGDPNWGAHSQDAPLLMVILVVVSLVSLMATLSSGRMNSKTIAMLGILTAVNAVLRAVPGPAGFSAMYVLPIVAGYVFGSHFGFLLGTLSVMVSALIGAGVGPWLPYQMIAVGWIGLSSGWLPKLADRRLELGMLVVWGVLWGILFGALMNLWFWPFIYQEQQANMYWQPGLGLGEGLRRYAVFYLATSAWWDLAGAVGNALLVGLFGMPLLKLLKRFQRRFFFKVD